MKTGVLALQGSFYDHVQSLELINQDYVLVKDTSDLSNINSLILPGGESTSMIKIQENNDLFSGLKKLIESGIPTLGTCAGLILLAKDVIDGETSLGVLNTVVERNAYGRQNQSFEGLVNILGNKEMYCFIRAPKILSYEDSVTPIATIDNEVVGVIENNIVGLSFHPELTNDKVYLDWLSNFLKDGVNVRSL
ncbi:MAG: pyridoxal 5'-phosphate synthase glutaminase subunit PdxT [Actinobacteria bacterium]|jgi:5'-phosphate synthase pdxT subunit|nr:pyridoxal 5'-phosphate synthase glutaminase subunit PdxT [Actinomycetota bacterium]|tara:strand:- start:253 stop:831 length:579 start_codon:yes stop_codon:yes gene_type:complete